MAKSTNIKPTSLKVGRPNLTSIILQQNKDQDRSYCHKLPEHQQVHATSKPSTYSGMSFMQHTYALCFWGCCSFTKPYVLHLYLLVIHDHEYV
ncbi:hypothetical protein Dimus_020192 [Dionaea muscipula]